MPSRKPAQSQKAPKVGKSRKTAKAPKMPKSRSSKTVSGSRKSSKRYPLTKSRAAKPVTSRKSAKAKSRTKPKASQSRKRMDGYERKDLFDYESVEDELQEVRASIGAAFKLSLTFIKDKYRRFSETCREVKRAGLTLLAAYFRVFDTIQQYLPVDAEAARAYCNGTQNMNLSPDQAEAVEKAIIEQFLRQHRREATKLFKDLFKSVHDMQGRLDEIDSEIDPADQDLWMEAKSTVEADDDRDRTHMEFMNEFRYFTDIPSYM